MLHRLFRLKNDTILRNGTYLAGYFMGCAILWVGLSGSVLAEAKTAGNYKVEHEPAQSVAPGSNVAIDIRVEPTDDVSYVVVYVLREEAKKYEPVVLKKTARTYSGEIPSDKIVPPTLKYYIRLTSKKGANTLLFGEPSNPIEVEVKIPEESSTPVVPEFSFDLGALDSLASEFELFAAEDIVVSAAKRIQRLSESPSAVYVLTAEDIQAYGFTTFVDILRFAPGMDIYRINDGNAILGIRGFADEGNNLVLVLLDGRQVNVELFGSPFLDNLPVTLEEIERIEIVRGPGSTLYGANAFSGIVNIITKDPLKDQRRAKAFGAMGGLYRTTVADMYASGVSEGIGYRVSARYRTAGAYSDKFVDAIRQYAVRGLMSTQAMGNLRLDVGISSNTSEQYTVIGEVPMRMDRTHARVDWNMDDFTVVGSWDFWRGFMYPSDGVLQQIIPDLRVKTQTYDFETRWSHLWDPWDQLTIGANFRRNTFRSDSIATSSAAESRAGVFIQNELYPIDRMTINLGVRSDFSSFYEPQIEKDDGGTRDPEFLERITISPRFSLVYAPIEHHTFRLNGGQAFRKPSFWEQKMELTGLRRFASNFANEGLQNEKILSFEGGYIFDGIEGFRLQFDSYYYQLRDLIDYDPGTGAYQNNGNADMFGGELALRYRINRNISLFGNYSFQRIITLQENPLASRKDDPCVANEVAAAQLGEDDPAICKVVSEASPEHKASLGVNGNYGDWSGSANVAWVANRLWYNLHPEKGNILFPYKQNQELPAYFVVSARVAYRIIGGPVSVGLIGEQLQFDDHREFPGLDGISNIELPGFPDRTSNYGGEKIGGKIMAFVEGSF